MIAPSVSSAQSPFLSLSCSGSWRPFKAGYLAICLLACLLASALDITGNGLDDNIVSCLLIKDCNPRRDKAVIHWTSKQGHRARCSAE